MTITPPPSVFIRELGRALSYRAVLDNISWDHPPEFPRRTDDDPRVKALLSRLSRADVEHDPYSISRLAKEPHSNLPFVYIRGVLDNFNSEYTNEDANQKDTVNVADLALWDTGNEHTILCQDYFNVEIPDKTIRNHVI
jgi:hypothetical protein